MKIVVTYEAVDISRLIRQDLARQGIAATDADVKYNKGSAVVSVEVTADDAPIPVEAVPESIAAAPTVPPPPTPPTPPSTPPKLESIDGGNAPVDMASIFAQSKKIAANTEGKFPVPQHSMLEGESSEWPGDKS